MSSWKLEAEDWILDIGYWKLVVVLALVGGLLFFCLTVIRCTPASSPNPTATPSITLSPTPTLSPTFTPTSIPISTSTPTPSPSPTPSPTSTPSPISNIQYPSPPVTPSPTPWPTSTPLTPRILVIEHAEERAAGVADYLTRLGLPFDRLEIYTGDSLPSPERGQIIVLSGGPMSPHDVNNPAYPFLRPEADFLRQALQLEVPILGLCLGHQLLADIWGSEVEVGQQEVGWLPVQLNEAGTKDTLFDGVPQEFSPFHYHIEQAVTLPPEATVLASSPLCPVQAFRYGQTPVWGLQFHPEIGPQRGETILRSGSRLSLPADEIAPMIERGYEVYGDASERILYNFFRAAFAYYEADTDFPSPPLRPLALRESWRFQTWGTVTDLAVADLNGDDRAEVLMASLDKHAYAVNAAGQPLWKHPTRGSVYTLHVTDLDGQPAVLVGSDDNCLYALDGRGNQQWQYCTDSRITALSSSTKIVAASWDGYVYQVNPDGTLYQRYQVGEAGVEYPSALDSGPDGTVAIATNKGGLYLLSPTGDLRSLPSLDGYVRRLRLADLDDDGLSEVIAGSQAGDVIANQRISKPVVSVAEPSANWQTRRLADLQTCSVTDLAFADLDGDRSQEVLVTCGGLEPGVYAFSADGAQRWRYEAPAGVWAVAVADLDGDTWPEVTIGGDDGTVRVLDHLGRPRGNIALGGLVHGLRVHDLDGNGQPEILARTGWQVYALTVAPAWELSPLPSEGGGVGGEGSSAPADLLPPVADDEIELVATGDIMLARTVEERMNQYGSLYPFQAVYRLLQSADIAVGNLETPLTVRGQPADKQFIFRAHPEHIAALRTVGFDVLSLANNHVLDFPPDSMDDTLAALEKLGIATVGAGRGEAAAHRPAVLEVKGIKVAFLAFAAPRWRNSPEVPTATDVAWAEPEPVRRAVAQAQQEADLVIVILHTGTEYEAQANQQQRAVAYAAVEAGADLVIGHHPHVLQDVEIYQGVPIVYSLGNFVFDMDVIERTRDTAILRAVLAQDGVRSVDLYLARIVDDAQPRLRIAEDGSPLVQHVYPSPSPRPTATPSPTPTPPPISNIQHPPAVAFVSPRTGDDDIYLLDPLTGQIANLTAHPAEDRYPAWSPDGTRLAFASQRDGNWELYLWSAADGSVTRLTTDPAYDGAAAWSPDGTRLAFESYRDGNLEIYLLDLAADSAPVRLTNNKAGDYAPAWSPDGRYVAFTSWRDGDKEIYLADLEDGTVRNLTNYPAADDEAPAWSPDGTSIAFVSWRDGNAELYTMRPDGSRQQRLTANELYDGAPAWFPDSQHIVYTGYQEGEPFEVYDPYRPGAYRLFAIPVAGGPYSGKTNLVEQAFPADATAPTVDYALPWAELTRHLPYPRLTSTPTPTLPPGELYSLVPLEDIAVADSRLNAAVVESYRAWREEVREKTGWDYLGQLSDILRAPGYVSRKPYGYLTWHKTGRAVDLRFELPDEEGRDQLLIVRDDVGQRTYWRLFIRCRAQDGSQGRPLTERPWVFWFVLDKEKEPEAYEAGGRPTSIPSGYYEDFTAIARRHGWQRIPAFEEEDYDWRWDSLGREFWHYQKPDGLTWYQAMRQIYSEETLQELFNWQLCLERGQTEAVLRAKGVPTPTPTPTSTPNIPSQANLTGISGRPQALPLDCESRSAVDWAAYFGVKIDELEFFYSLPRSDNPDKGFVGDVHGSWGQIPPKPYGVHAEPIAALLRAYGLDAQAVRNFPLDALRAEIAAGRPVITWVTGQVAWGTPVLYTASDGNSTIVARYEHTVMVIGYNKREVSILDGAQVYTRQWGDFERSWAVLGNMAVIMRPHGDEQHAGYKESF